MAGNLFNQRFGAQQATNQNTFNQANQFYTQPGLQALSMTPQGFQAGQNMLNLGIGAIGQNTPQLVDLGMGFNLGAAERQNLAGLYAANQAASAARAAGKDAKTGSIFEGIGNVIGGLLG